MGCNGDNPTIHIDVNMEGVIISGFSVRGKDAHVNIAPKSAAKKADINNMVVDTNSVARIYIDGVVLEFSFHQGSATTKPEQRPTTNNKKNKPKESTKNTNTKEAASEPAPTTTSEEDAPSLKPNQTPEDSLLPATGEMHVTHTSGSSVAHHTPLRSSPFYEVICPACCSELGRANRESRFKESYDIARTGLHVENGRVFDQPDVLPFSFPVSTVTFGLIDGPSIRTRGTHPGYGFDLLCPLCAGIIEQTPSVENYGKLRQGKHLH